MQDGLLLHRHVYSNMMRRLWQTRHCGSCSPVVVWPPTDAIAIVKRGIDCDCRQLPVRGRPDRAIMELFYATLCASLDAIVEQWSLM
jgi:hypothetical protein